jgi:ABC-type dipeptide/oligopeptide/nickel transport system permease component
MGKFILQRLLAALVTIWIATIAVTILIHLVPGDPVRIMYGSFQTTPEELEAIRVRLGLDQPIWTQYFMYLERLLQGDLGGDWRSLILPALTLGLANAAVLARLTRSAMIDIFDQDFIRTARAKGLPRSIVLYRHALRSGLVPVVSMLGLQFAYLMGGAIVIENVFAWNGVGRLAIEAVLSRDYPLIQGFILFFATVVALASVVIDIAYAFLDPRIRYS